MKINMLKSSITLIMLVLLTSCVVPQTMQGISSTTPYFREAPPGISLEDSVLFSQALRLQKNNKLRSSFKRWNLFLKRNPRSFEALNNIGLVLYEDDQVDKAIRKLEAAWTLEPGDERIRKNLIRSLRFRATMLKEVHEYGKSIKYLERTSKLSNRKEREKVEFDIERLQDRIFTQVKKTDTLEAYGDFVDRYPNSPGNSDDARRYIRAMKKRYPRAVPLQIGVEGAMDPQPPVSGVIGSKSDTLPVYK